MNRHIGGGLENPSYLPRSLTLFHHRYEAYNPISVSVGVQPTWCTHRHPPVIRSACLITLALKVSLD